MLYNNKFRIFYTEDVSANPLLSNSQNNFSQPIPPSAFYTGTNGVKVRHWRHWISFECFPGAPCSWPLWRVWTISAAEPRQLSTAASTGGRAIERHLYSMILKTFDNPMTNSSFRCPLRFLPSLKVTRLRSSVGKKRTIWKITKIWKVET